MVIGSQALMNEVSDESRFSKVVSAGLEQVRNGVHGRAETWIKPRRHSNLIQMVFLLHMEPKRRTGVCGILISIHVMKAYLIKGIAHRILIPAFGPLSIRGMFDEMHVCNYYYALSQPFKSREATILLVIGTCG